MKETNRRRLERFDIALPAQVAVGSGTGKNVFTLTTANVSAGGAFFKTDAMLPVGTEVLVELTLLAELFRNTKPANSALIRLAGKVLRHETDGMAIAFAERFHMQPATYSPA